MKTNARILAWGDQGDGTYRNPILFADFSDPDVIRVGDDFYLIASDFNWMGIQVLHSKDLVNWDIIGQVFSSLTVSPVYDEMRGYGCGTWAPSLRHHNGRFYIYVCTPYEGLFMWHTTDPRGPWSDVHCLKGTENWEDPCPFWDDNGNAYLIRGRLGAGPLILHRMTPDGLQLLDDGQEIYYGRYSEGPKMFKRNGWYYVSFPENTVGFGCQSLIRSKHIYGPYEKKVILPDYNPHQGGMVDLDNGEGWFIGFKYMEHLGRVCHLVPYWWQDDDWPVFGHEGKSVIAWDKPNVGSSYPISRPTVSDEFDSPTLAPIWQWNHNPLQDKWSLTDRPGFLRLKSSPAPDHSSARNTLTQKIWDTCGVIDVKLDATGLAPGQQAGFAFLNANEMAWIGVEGHDGGIRLAYGAHGGENVMGPALSNPVIWLCGEYSDEITKLAYSLDGTHYLPVPVKFRLKFAGWKAARVGLYSFGSAEGYADFDYFRFVYASTLPLCR